MPFTTIPTTEKTGDGLGKVTDLAQVAILTGNKNPNSILDALSKFFSTPLAEVTYKCHKITCPPAVPPPKEETKTSEKEKENKCSKLDQEHARVTAPKESGNFTLYFEGGLGGRILSVAASGAAAANLTVKIDLKYVVKITDHDFDVQGCGDGECKPDKGKCVVFTHCEVAFLCEVSAGVDLGFGSVATGAAVAGTAAGKLVITAGWTGNPTYSIDVECK